MKTITNTLNFYRIDYFSKRQNSYTYKIVKAKSYDKTIKKSRIKNIEEITLIDTEFGFEMTNCIDCWEKAIQEKDFQKSIFLQGQWKIYQLALKHFYGIDYSFTRTNDYYGIIKNDESDWLYKVKK